MLHLLGIGYKKEHLNFEQFEIIKKSKKVFLEYYTSFFENKVEDLEKFLGKKIEILNREDLEINAQKILDNAKNFDTSLLIIGDPLIATTHTDILLRAQEQKIKFKIYNNISVINLITKTGLQLYKFGKTTSIPFFNEKFMPETPFKVLLENIKINSHSLILLDLNPFKNEKYTTKEFLDIQSSINFLLEIQKNFLDKKIITEKIIKQNSKIVICSKLGMQDEKIIYSTISNFTQKNFNLKPPLCLIIPGRLHEMEKEFLEKFYSN